MLDEFVPKCALFGTYYFSERGGGSILAKQRNKNVSVDERYLCFWLLGRLLVGWSLNFGNFRRSQNAGSAK